MKAKVRFSFNEAIYEKGDEVPQYIVDIYPHIVEKEKFVFPDGLDAIEPEKKAVTPTPKKKK